MILEYKGYVGKLEEIGDDGRFYGVVANLERDHVEFVGRNAKELGKSFEESIDVYLEGAQEDGYEPEKPFSGRFVVRVEPSVHQQANALSKALGQSLNAVVTSAIETYLVGFDALQKTLEMATGKLHPAMDRALAKLYPSVSLEEAEEEMRRFVEVTAEQMQIISDALAARRPLEESLDEDDIHEALRLAADLLPLLQAEEQEDLGDH